MPISLFIIAAVWCLAIFGIWFYKAAKADLRWKPSLSIGTVLIGIGGLIVSFLPVLNFAICIVGSIFMVLAHLDQIEEFLSRPIWKGRKK